MGPPPSSRSSPPPSRSGTASPPLLGAVSFGVALGVGQLCFAAALVWLLLS